MGRGRRLLSIGLLVAALAAIAWLLFGEMRASGLFGAAASRTDRATPDRDDVLARDLATRARLRGLPGLADTERGTGRLIGVVAQYVPGRGSCPLPDLEVRILGVGSDLPPIHREVRTGPTGAFAFERLPVLVGYAVVVDHDPFRRVELRGVNVRRGVTTDIGTVVLGAPSSLFGEVVDAAGREVSHARVQVLPDQGLPHRFDWRRGLYELQASLEPLAEDTTSRDGRFRLEGLPPGRYVIRVSADGYATSFREGVWVTPDERAADVIVVLDPGAGFEGRVLDDTGRGLADARVLAVTMGGTDGVRLDRVETRSQADGRYRLTGLIAGQRYFLEAWADGHAPAGRLVVPRDVDRLDLVLAESGRVEGHVTDGATGAPVAGAEVTLVAGTVNTLSPVSTLTRADGSYALENVSPGPVLFFAAKAEGYPSGSFALGKGPLRRVEAGGTTVVDWTLESGVAAFGSVRDEAGRPVPYATVAFSDPRRRSEGGEKALADADGAYRVEGLRRSVTYDVSVTAPGYAPVTEEAAGRLEVPADAQEVRHDVRIDHGATITGVVRTPQGQPLGGARLTVVPATPDRALEARLRELVAISAPTGRYVLPGVPPRTVVEVLAEHDAWVGTKSEALRLAPGETRELALALGAGVHLEGRVTDLHGSPVADARIRWGPLSEEDAGRVGDAFRADAHLTPRVVRSDAGGHFALARLPPGRLLLKVEAEGYAAWYRKDLVLLSEGVRPELPIRLTPAGRISGTVRDALTRKPIANAWVYAREERPEGQDAPPPDAGHVRALVSAQTDDRGRFTLEGVPPVATEVVVWLALGYVAEVQDRKSDRVRRRGVEPGRTGVDFDLERVEPEPEGG